RRMGGDSDSARSVASTISAEIFGQGLSRSTLDAASRVAAGGSVSVAARAAGLCLGSPEMQARQAIAWDISRRVFLRGAGPAALGVGSRPSSLLSRTPQAAAAGSRALVPVLL